jgi:hypothetical protein
MDNLSQDQRVYLQNRVNTIRARLLNKAHNEEAKKQGVKRPFHLNWDVYFLEGKIKFRNKKKIANALKMYCRGHNPEGGSNFHLSDLFEGTNKIYNEFTGLNQGCGQPKKAISDELQAVIERINEECDKVLDIVMLPGSDAKGISAMLEKLSNLKW